MCGIDRKHHCKLRGLVKDGFENGRFHTVCSWCRLIGRLVSANQCLQFIMTRRSTIQADLDVTHAMQVTTKVMNALLYYSWLQAEPSMVCLKSWPLLKLYSITRPTHTSEGAWCRGNLDISLRQICTSLEYDLPLTTGTENRHLIVGFRHMHLVFPIVKEIGSVSCDHLRGTTSSVTHLEINLATSNIICESSARFLKMLKYKTDVKHAKNYIPLSARGLLRCCCVSARLSVYLSNYLSRF